MTDSKLFSMFFPFFFIITFASYLNKIHKCSTEQTEALLLFKHNHSFVNYNNHEYKYFNNDCHRRFGSDYHPIYMNWNTSTDCCNWNGVMCDFSTGDVIGLDLSCGMLQGTIHPNSSLLNLPRLQRLNLAFNGFFGSRIPSDIGRLSNSLTHLNLSKCGFTGQVPTDITLLHKLVSLDLSSNYVDYVADLKVRPLDFINLIHNCTNLEELSLGAVNISAVLPTSLNISSLKLLKLRSTGLEGKLPHYIFSLHSLETLDLSGNNFTGEIPSEILVNLTRLSYLDLTYNKLNGTLPSWLFSSPSLKYLFLNNNKFSGKVPFESFALPSLKMLDLSRNNQLVGEIDVQAFRQLTNLTHLRLSYNNFSGEWELDTLLSSLENLVSLDLSYSGFSVTTKNVDHYVNPGFGELYMVSCRLKVLPKSFRAMKQVTRLDLSSNEIHGQIPHWAGEIGGNRLYHLNLSHNFITGLPKFQWCGLKELYLQSNLIEGPFPPLICNMSNLISLDMSNNRISSIGVIPKNNSLRVLNVKSNKIEGSFPPSICDMRKLYSLDISNNSLGGVIPECVGSMNTLSMIDLGTNNFHGTIPNVFGGDLEGLILNGNQLEGEVPYSLSKCRSLKVLDLGNNKLNGTFPEWLGGLSWLHVLLLKSNNFHGPIETFSATKHAFSSLQVLDLSYNWFSGKLPGTFFQNFKAMQNMVRSSTKPQYLSLGSNYYYYSIIVVVKDVQLKFTKLLVEYTIVDLSNNKFEGEIPNTIGSLNSLKVLNLSHNNLNGEIPNALGNISGIESLDLSWNQLIGEIPQSLTSMTALSVLDLSQNHLVGRIPQGKQFNTFDESSYGGNLGLCGFPLPNKCEQLSSPDVYGDGDQEEVDGTGITWKVVTLGFGCGTLLGLVMGNLMLSTRKVKWFNAIFDAAESLVFKKKRRRIYFGK